MKETTVYIPETVSLELEGLIEDCREYFNEVESKYKFDANKLIALIGFFRYKCGSLYRKRKMQKILFGVAGSSAFTRIHNSELSAITHDYLPYLTFLVSIGLVKPFGMERTKSGTYYTGDEKVKGRPKEYAITRKMQGRVVPIPISGFKVCSKYIKSYQPIKEKGKHKIKSIDVEGLEILSSSLRRLRVELEEALLKANELFKSKDGIEDYNEQFEKEFFKDVANLLMLDDGEIYITQDMKFGRVYHALTNINKDLREFIYIEGEELGMVDISNAQSYFITLLFNPSFYNPTESKKVSADHTPVVTYPPIDISLSKLQHIPLSLKGSMVFYQQVIYPLVISLLYPSLDKYFNTRSSYKPIYSISNSYFLFFKSIHSILIRESKEKVINKGIQRFIQDVVSGELCNKIMWKSIEEEILDDRDQVKLELNIMYNGKSWLDSRTKEVFKELYDGVVDVINLLKKEEEKPKTWNAETKKYDIVEGLDEDKVGEPYLPMLGHSLESYMILEKCVKRIQREKPDALCITIHDCIISEKENVAYLKKVMQEEGKAMIGYAPHLKDEQIGRRKKTEAA